MQRLSRLQKFILFVLLAGTSVLGIAMIWTAVAGDAGPSPTPPAAAATGGEAPTPAAPLATPAPAVTDSPAPSPAPNLVNPPPADDGQGQKLVALTFDDGPDVTTVRLLDALRERGVSATFFVIGQHIQRHPDILKRIAEDGHEIGNHTMNHRFFDTIPIAEVRREIAECSDLIEALTGIRPTLLRAPGGIISDEHFDELERQGLASVNWWVDPQDWRPDTDKTAILEASFGEGTHTIRDGAIVLLHDLYESSVDAAIVMMDRLIAGGYRLVTVTELLETRKGGIQPGGHYIEGFSREP